MELINCYFQINIPKNVDTNGDTRHTLKEKIMKTSTEIRTKFINENADFLLTELGQVLRGEGEFSCKSNHVLTYALDILEQAINNAGDVVEIEATTAHGVVELLQKGRISLVEARELMQILKVQQEIEELPKLLKKLEMLERGEDGQIT